MRTELLQILSSKTFFNIIKSNETEIQYLLNSPSKLLLQNIYLQWLQSIWVKADKHFPVLLNKPHPTTVQQHPIGVIKYKAPDFKCNKPIVHNLSEFVPKTKINMEFSLLVNKQDVMQYFIQWQRYRKYWWSSITTTPSLFAVNDIKYRESSADADIVVRLPWGEQPVENVSITTGDMSEATLTCATSAECALLTALGDAAGCGTREGYRRLHRKIAPYKFSFALKYDDDKNKETLADLATLVNCRLAKKNIKTWFPDFSLTLEDQIRQNLGMGVVYTAVLSEPTLNNGIFHLLNSSTMLQEQVHLGDFDSYATLLCGN